ncbi:non-homologous end-joining DNA ligase [Kitasatospora sp. MAP5-34]|uniref:non-homologous end-joining DNA ligase n=1 Tax=Kitasatospora sp. MAP5-34 TaxID=3035102 RepID=UPI0024755BE2|nr:non-homologous end-joining DNA ligase [Kitasatospora sp. MAP5-34]
MLATPSERREFGAGWILERKLDGIRALAHRDGDLVRLLSRNGKDLSAAYPELVEALARQPVRRFVVDGEIVALHHGVTSFERLQRRMQLREPARARATGVEVTYYLFDLLHLEGYDATGLPLRFRKQLLRRAIRYGGPLRFTVHRNAEGTAPLADACARGWEGLIAKRADAPYVQRRSPDWLKLKCSASQELVIGGWTDPAGSRIGFGALLMGHFEDGRLRYAGKVGTGFDAATLRALGAALEQLAQPASPFADPVAERGAHWVAPRLIAQVGFSGWTREGRLRHPRFLGLRTDKDPQDVTRERPPDDGAPESDTASDT